MSTVTKADYARMKDWNKSTVTRYAQDGKLVLTPEGLVDVERSDARLATMRDPAKDSVRDRHEHDRRAKSSPAGGGGEAPAAVEPTEPTSYGERQRALAEIDAHRAALLRMERAEKEGQLADTETVRKMAFDAARAARNALFNLQHRLDPLLAGETDVAKRAMLWDQEVRAICNELARGCGVPEEGDGRG